MAKYRFNPLKGLLNLFAKDKATLNRAPEKRRVGGGEEGLFVTPEKPKSGAAKVLFLAVTAEAARGTVYENLPYPTTHTTYKSVIHAGHAFDVWKVPWMTSDPTSYFKDAKAAFIFADGFIDAMLLYKEADERLPKDATISFVQTTEKIDKSIQDKLQEKRIPVVDGRLGADLGEMLVEGVAPKAPVAKARMN